MLPTYVRPPFFLEKGREWLRSGVLRQNTANAYARLLAVAPGYGVNYNVAADRAADFAAPTPGGAQGGTSSFNVHTLYWNGSNYLLVPPAHAGGGGPELRCSANLAGTDIGTALQMATGTVTGHCQLTSGGVTIFSTTSGGAASLRYVAANGAAVSNALGHTAMAHSGVASNGLNLAVAIAAGPSNTANGVHTTADGINWVPRTGSSGAIATIMLGIIYSQALARFFKWGYASPNDVVILSSANGYTDTVAKAADTAYAAQILSYNGGYQHSAAATPTAVLIPVARNSDGLRGWLKTTDGAAWAFVSPYLTPGLRIAPGISGFNLQYDAPRNRLVAWSSAGDTSGDGPAYYFSTDNGDTWQAGPGFDDEHTGVRQILGFSVANGQDLVHVGGSYNGTANYLFSYPGSKFGVTPSYVGLTSQYQSPVGITAYVRIK